MGSKGVGVEPKSFLGYWAQNVRDDGVLFTLLFRELGDDHTKSLERLVNRRTLELPNL